MTRQRLTVQEVAEILGTSVDAVRMRVRRGSLASEKDPDGRVYVWVDGDSSETKPRLDGEPDALISELRAHNATLREQLEAERDANRENRGIIAALTQRIPELEPPSEQEAPKEPPGGPQSAGAGSNREETPPRGFASDGAQEDAREPRSWWRRMFGG